MTDRKEPSMEDKNQGGCGCGCTLPPEKGGKTVKPAPETPEK